MSVVEKFSSKPGILLKELLKQPPALFKPHRIAIMVQLYSAGAIDFPQLRHDLELTDGSLAAHLKALANEGLIELKREQVESRTRTTNVITSKGIHTIAKMFNILCDISEEFQI